MKQQNYQCVMYEMGLVGEETLHERWSPSHSGQRQHPLPGIWKQEHLAQQGLFFKQKKHVLYSIIIGHVGLMFQFSQSHVHGNGKNEKK